MYIDCSYLNPSLEFSDGFLVIVEKIPMLLNRKTNVACFFIGENEDVEDNSFCISDNFSLLWERFGNSTCRLELENSEATVKITHSLQYKIPLEFSNENEEGIIAMKKAAMDKTEHYCEVEFTEENRYDILEFFEGGRIVQIYSDQSHVIIEDNEFRLKLKILTPQIKIAQGTFFLNQILPRSNSVLKLEYKKTHEDGPLFIRENGKNIIIVSPYCDPSLKGEIVASEDSKEEITSSSPGDFFVSEEDGLVIWSPSST